MSLLRLLAPALNGMFSRTRPTHALLTNPGFSLLQQNLLGACGISKCSAGSQSPFLRSLLLRAPSPLTQLTNSFKTKSSLKRRCKDCYFVRRKGRLFVICKTHPRHKQRQG